MAGTTISFIHLTTVDLDNGATENPATVTGIIEVAGTALQANGTTYWTIDNQGVIIATGTIGTGTIGIAVDIAGLGQLTNSKNIDGAQYGVALVGGGGRQEAA